MGKKDKRTFRTAPREFSRQQARYGSLPSASWVFYSGYLHGSNEPEGSSQQAADDTAEALVESVAAAGQDDHLDLSGHFYYCKEPDAEVKSEIATRAQKCDIKSLNLSENLLSTIPSFQGANPFVTGFKSLKELNLSHNAISLHGIDNNRFSFPGLLVLMLNDNSISDVSPIGCITSLTVLHLQSNNIVQIAPLTTLTSLVTLELSFNKIETLPDEIGALRQLKELGLRSNRLTSIEPLASVIEQLSTLVVTGNEIDIQRISTELFQALESKNFAIDYINRRGHACCGELTYQDEHANNNDTADATMQDDDEGVINFLLIGNPSSGTRPLSKALLKLSQAQEYSQKARPRFWEFAHLSTHEAFFISRTIFCLLWSLDKLEGLDVVLPAAVAIGAGAKVSDDALERIHQFIEFNIQPWIDHITSKSRAFCPLIILCGTTTREEVPTPQAEPIAQWIHKIVTEKLERKKHLSQSHGLPQLTTSERCLLDADSIFAPHISPDSSLFINLNDLGSGSSGLKPTLSRSISRGLNLSNGNITPRASLAGSGLAALLSPMGPFSRTVSRSSLDGPFAGMPLFRTATPPLPRAVTPPGNTLITSSVTETDEYGVQIIPTLADSADLGNTSWDGAFGPSSLGGSGTELITALETVFERIFSDRTRKQRKLDGWHNEPLEEEDKVILDVVVQLLDTHARTNLFITLSDLLEKLNCEEAVLAYRCRCRDEYHAEASIASSKAMIEDLVDEEFKEMTTRIVERLLKECKIMEFKLSSSYAHHPTTGELPKIAVVYLLKPEWLRDSLMNISEGWPSIQKGNEQSFVKWSDIRAKLPSITSGRLRESFSRADLTAASPEAGPEYSECSDQNFKFIRLILEELNVIIPVPQTTPALLPSPASSPGSRELISPSSSPRSAPFGEMLELGYRPNAAPSAHDATAVAGASTVFSVRNLCDLDPSDEFIMPIRLQDGEQKVFDHCPKKGCIVLEQAFTLSRLTSDLIPRLLAQTKIALEGANIRGFKVQPFCNAFVLDTNSVTVSVVQELPTAKSDSPLPNKAQIRVIGEGYVMLRQEILLFVNVVGQAIIKTLNLLDQPRNVKSLAKCEHVCPVCLMRQRPRSKCGRLIYRESLGRVRKSPRLTDQTADVFEIDTQRDNGLSNRRTQSANTASSPAASANVVTVAGSKNNRKFLEYQRLVPRCQYGCLVRFDFFIDVRYELTSLFPNDFQSMLAYLKKYVTVRSPIEVEANASLSPLPWVAATSATIASGLNTPSLPAPSWKQPSAMGTTVAASPIATTYGSGRHSTMSTAIASSPMAASSANGRNSLLLSAVSPPFSGKSALTPLVSGAAASSPSIATGVSPPAGNNTQAPRQLSMGEMMLQATSYKVNTLNTRYEVFTTTDVGQQFAMFCMVSIPAMKMLTNFSYKLSVIPTTDSASAGKRIDIEPLFSFTPTTSIAGSLRADSPLSVTANSTSSLSMPMNTTHQVLIPALKLVADTSKRILGKSIICWRTADSREPTELSCNETSITTDSLKPPSAMGGTLLEDTHLIPCLARVVCHRPDMHPDNCVYQIVSRFHLAMGSPVTNDRDEVVGIVLRTLYPVEATPSGGSMDLQMKYYFAYIFTSQAAIQRLLLRQQKGKAFG